MIFIHFFVEIKTLLNGALAAMDRATLAFNWKFTSDGAQNIMGLPVSLYDLLFLADFRAEKHSASEGSAQSDSFCGFILIGRICMIMDQK